MSISSEITRIQGNISDAYTAASAKGATLPATQNSANLASTISTISGGGVDTRGWIPKTIDANGKLVGSSTMPNFAGVEDLSNNVLSFCCKGATSLVGDLNFPSLTTITGSNAMESAFQSSGLTSVSFPALTTIVGSSAMKSAFQGSGLTSVDLSALTTISGGYAMSYTFNNCTGLTSISFPALTTISGTCAMEQAFSYLKLTSISFPALTTISGSDAMQYAFYSATKLESLDFPSLTTITGSYAMERAFSYSNLKSLSFPALKSNSFGSTKSQFSSMFSGVSGCTVHFPSNLDPQSGSTAISSLSGYPDFGGTNIVLAFDLPATE